MKIHRYESFYKAKNSFIELNITQLLNDNHMRAHRNGFHSIGVIYIYISMGHFFAWKVHLVIQKLMPISQGTNS